MVKWMEGPTLVTMVSPSECNKNDKKFDDLLKNQIDRNSTDLTKLSVSYFAEDFMFHDWKNGDDAQISVDGTNLVGGATINLGSSGRFLEITKSGGSTNTEVTIVGKVLTPGSQTASSATKNYTLGGVETKMVWDMFTEVTGVSLNNSDGSVKIGTADGMVEVPNYRVKYNGTNFDDVMYSDVFASMMSSLGGGRWQCLECGYQSKSTNVRYHIESKHVQSGGHTCAVCGEFLRTRHGLNTHMSTKHRKA